MKSNSNKIKNNEERSTQQAWGDIGTCFLRLGCLHDFESVSFTKCCICIVILTLNYLNIVLEKNIVKKITETDKNKTKTN